MPQMRKRTVLWAPGSFTRRRRSRRVGAPSLPSSSRHAACCAWCWWQRCTGVGRLQAAMAGWLEQLQRRSSAHRRWARSSRLMMSPARRGTAPPAWLQLTCSLLNAPAPHQPLPTSRNHPHLSLTAPLQLQLLLQCTGNHHLGAAATCATAEAAASARLLQSMRRQLHAWHTAYVTARECPLPVAAAGAGHHQLVALRLGAGEMWVVVGGRIWWPRASLG